MKRLILCLVIIILIIPAFGNLRYSYDFLVADETVDDNSTSVHGTGHVSRSIDISTQASIGLITVKYDPATPAAVSIDFEFIVSYDSGTTYTSSFYIRVRSNTNATADANGDIIVSSAVNLYGVSHIRLLNIVVNDGAGNCAEINATMSF